MNWQLRLARMEDVPTLEQLIPLSVRTLQAPHYSAAQMAAAMGPVFGVDRQLINDGTYFVVENAGVIIGCGGWSRRKSLFGADTARAGEDAMLDPATDPARIRAFLFIPTGHVAASAKPFSPPASPPSSPQIFRRPNSSPHSRVSRFISPVDTARSSVTKCR